MWYPRYDDTYLITTTTHHTSNVIHSGYKCSVHVCLWCVCATQCYYFVSFHKLHRGSESRPVNRCDLWDMNNQACSVATIGGHSARQGTDVRTYTINYMILNIYTLVGNVLLGCQFLHKQKCTIFESHSIKFKNKEKNKALKIWLLYPEFQKVTPSILNKTFV